MKHGVLNSLAPKVDALAIERCSQFLESRNCLFWGENELNEVLPTRPSKPDFFVRNPEKKALLAEVESFKKERSSLVALRQNRVMSGTMEADKKRFSTAVQHGCRQLKLYRDLDFPSIVILDDFARVGFAVNTDHLGQHLGGWFEDNSSERAHVSAVAWLLGEHPSLFLRAFLNPNASRPLGSSFFGSHADEYWRKPGGKFWERIE